jgi:hypothetical protein
MASSVLSLAVNPGPPQRHGTYYLQHSTDIFLVSFRPSLFRLKFCLTVDQVENTLYKLSRDVLCSDSQVFRDMFASGVPGESGVQMDGASDQNPIVLQQQCTTNEFNYLLAWLYPGLYATTHSCPSGILLNCTLFFRGRSAPPYTQERLVSILKLAFFYDMEHAKDFAIRELEKRTTGSQENVIQLLVLARCYRVEAWIKHAFEKLIYRRISSFSMEETEAIGTRTMLCLAKTLDAVEEFKKYLARFPPPIIHNTICIQRDLCNDAYTTQWWMRVGRALLDPSVPISALSVPSFVREVTFTGMTDGCLRKTMDAASDTLIFSTEVDIVDGVLAKLLIMEGFELV